SRLTCQGSGVLFYIGGACGGVADFVTLNPKLNTFASVVVEFANEVVFTSCQIDDEGTTDPTMGAAIYVVQGTLTIDHGQLVRSTPGVVVECSLGGSFDSRAWM